MSIYIIIDHQKELSYTSRNIFVCNVYKDIFYSCICYFLGINYNIFFWLNLALLILQNLQKNLNFLLLYHYKFKSFNPRICYFPIKVFQNLLIFCGDAWRNKYSLSHIDSYSLNRAYIWKKNKDFKVIQMELHDYKNSYQNTNQILKMCYKKLGLSENLMFVLFMLMAWN